MSALAQISVFARAGVWLGDFWQDLLLFSIPLLSNFTSWCISDEFINCLPFSDYLRLEIQKVAILASIIIFIIYIPVFYFLDIKRKPRISKLVTENGQLKNEYFQMIERLYTLCDGYLYIFASGSLGFGAVSSCYERITLYAHDSNDSFVAIGRVSFHPKYKEKNRPKYPDNKGCIAKAWESRWHFSNDYPDPETASVSYYRRCKKDGMSKEEIDNIRMKSRLYCGYRIDSKRGQNDPLAVLIIEATLPDRYTEEHLKDLLQNDDYGYLSELTEKIVPIMPSYEEARDMGF